MKSITLYLTLILLTLGITNCEKSQLGCTDPDNYYSEADTDNNS